ncbi:unnamed protein product [Mesocestoides corti]|uniref:Uncharacterized protein n=1 Tax=Mesocestoides corti TaxID=53468 RepID=A0A0R3UIK7_MESCO|nr:unnamed protein product [Mesocestoides corti]
MLSTVPGWRFGATQRRFHICSLQRRVLPEPTGPQTVTAVVQHWSVRVSSGGGVIVPVNGEKQRVAIGRLSRSLGTQPNRSSSSSAAARTHPKHFAMRMGHTTS